MAGFDTNALMPTALPQQTNPLEFASQAIGVRNALLGNQIRQEEFNARKARGAAYAHHYNALTGQYDMPAVQAEMGATDAGQYGLPEAVTTIRSQQGQGITNDTNTLALKRAKMGAYLSLLDGIKNPQDLDAAGAVATGYLGESPKEVGQIKQFIMSHPDGLQAGVRAAQTSLLDAQGQIDTRYGTNVTANNGSGTYIGTRASASHGGAFTPTQYMPKGLSAADLAQPASYIDEKTGKTVKTTVGGYLQRLGVNIDTGQIDNVTPNGALPAGAENYPWNNGRYGGAPSSSGESTSPIVGTVDAELSPGQTSAAQAAGTAAGNQYASAGQQAAKFGNRIYQARKALEGLEELGPYSQGTAGEYRNRLANIAQSFGMPVNPEKAATYDETNKYLVQMAMSQPGAQHSDQQLATALTANSSMHINNLAAQDVIKANIALDRRANAAYMAFHQKYPGTSAQTHADEWPQFVSDYTQTRDARAYMWDLMSGKQRTAMWKGMNPKERGAFMEQVQQAGLGSDE